MARASSLLDYTAQRPAERSAFVEYATAAPSFDRSKVREVAYAPFGLTDGQRLLVYDGITLVGWVGVLRAGGPRFSRADRRWLAPLAQPARRALILAHRMAGHPSLEESAELVLGADGEVHHASRRGRAWLDGNPHGRAFLRGRVQRLDRGAAAGAETDDVLLDGWALHLIRLDGGSTRYLALLESAQPVELSPLEQLPPSLRRVATELARGLTDKEIACALDMPLSTARTYVRRALERSGYDSRTRFAAAVAGSRRPPTPREGSQP